MPEAVPPNAPAPRGRPAALETDGAPALWLVAIGASAGGLEALQRFFATVEAPTGAAFVVVQHLAPDHRSMMSELLARHCQLPVHEAVAGDRLAADRVYLMPPGVVMTLAEDALQFTPRPQQGVSLPIDRFLESLAGHRAEHAVAVILSGSGSDGAQGARALREAGGFVMAQQPESARFDSMPRSVLAATPADAVLPPDELARQVVRLTRGEAGRLAGGELVNAPSVKPALQRLFERLLATTGVDFSQYKLPTVMRRIERRMALSGDASLADYAARVEDSVEESELLRQELLIPVTGFFRDTAAFEALAAALRERVRQLPANQPLRLWSAGCATGEEAYSLAIAALEACQAEQRWPGIKVFATDVDNRVLAVGSSGIYAAGAADTLGPARVAQHFQLVEGRLAARTELRQLVLFARHNLLQDAPFTRMDLVTCRNTLIYLQTEPQLRVMRRLQYALNAGGLLFLGSSESLGPLHADFEVVDASAKLYRLLRPLATSVAVRDGLGTGRAPPALRNTDAPPPRPASASAWIEQAGRSLMLAYAPATLLVSAQHRLLHAWGPTERLLRLPPGQPSLDVMRLLPPRLAAVAGAAMQQALVQEQPCAMAPLRVQLGEQWVQVRTVARPLVVPGQSPSVMLSFELEGQPTEASELPPLQGAELDRLAELERELADSRQTLQTKIEELEAANEELQATNEELMSANEELQSTNEELQSVNEELYTVNAEYNAKLELVSGLHADLDGMSQATGIATIFVDPNLALVRFTPEATLLFRLRSSDVGRAITDFRCQLDYPELLADLRSALERRTPVEREVPGPAGTRYLARVIGYGDLAGGNRRAVLSLIDITRLHDAERLQRLIDSLPEHLALLDPHGRIVQVNRAWLDFSSDNGGTADRTGPGANYLDVLDLSDDPLARAVRQGLQQVLRGELAEFRQLYPCHGPGEKRWFVLHASPLRGHPTGRPQADGAVNGAVNGAVVAHLNITPWLHATAPELHDG